MKEFVPREGVCLVNVCGEYLFVATRAAMPFCPRYQFTNESGAYFWELLKNCGTPNRLAEQASEYYGVSKEKIRPGLETFLNSLEENGFLYVRESGD